MKALKLSLDDLAVDSFSTLPQSEMRGTVRGARYSEPGQTCENSCNECWVQTTPCMPLTEAYYYCAESGVESHCNHTCVWTCAASCDFTCEANNCQQTDYTCANQTCTCYC